jgi:SAM-dependent methyltransferase
MDIKTQIAQGKLRCVRTQQTLALKDGKLLPDYPLYRGIVPAIFKDETVADSLDAEGSAMAEEYASPSLYQRIRKALYKDYNAHIYDQRFTELITENDSAEKCFLSIGGGPLRRSPHITNMNIGPYPNVDIVSDAHELPYHDATVDAIHCDAVLEHLHTPIKAVQEMQRVLKKGGKVLSVVPFMQSYHGYPHHYQNYTITGHELLYRSNGFQILESGACQGPVFAMTVLCSRFCTLYFPPVLNHIFGKGLLVIGLVLRPLDRLLEKHPNRYVLASSTYVLAQKL